MKIVSKISFICTVFICSVALGSSSVSIQAQVDRTKVTIGDRIDFRLTLSAPPQVKFDSLKLGNRLGDFEIVSSSSQLRTGKNRNTLKWNFTLVGWKTGEFEIPPVEIVYQDSGGKQQRISSDPIAIKLESVLASAGDSSEIKGLKSQLELGSSIWKYLVPGMLLLLALAATALWFRLKKKPVPVRMAVIPPWEKALRDLKQLQELFRTGKIEARAYYFQLSEIIRAYLEKRFDIPLLESTTQEIQVSLPEECLNGTPKNKFLEFLNRSDLIKFAKLAPEKNNIDTDWQMVLDIVQNTMPRPEPQNLPQKMSA
ncbi:MAG: BatD family protein [candidate division Zixibacteria bacterium]|nr:BatD family protein [candidate division Zixibacteria bacterium]